MKKTIRINISGYIFNIDEDAYEKLQQYLNSITQQFIDSNEGNEIIADVESRIAELFQERIGDRKEVINLTDIDYVIEVMGKPEDFEEPPIDGEEPEFTESQTKRSPKRIYRDPDNRYIGGVSAGLAAYFGIDPTIVRVIFLLTTFFYGTSVLVYIILWIVSPEAKTRAQKLEMRGQDINLSNIETSIKNEFKQVKSNFNHWQKTKNSDKFRSNIGEILNFIFKIFGLVAKIFLIFFGVIFLMTGIGLLGGMTGLYFFDNTIFSPFSWNNVPFSIREFIGLFTDSFNAKVLMISSYLLVLIPIISIIYFGLRFIFKFKSKNKYFGLYSGVLWFVSLIVLIVSGFKIAYEMRAHEEMSQSYNIEKKSSDTLYIDLFKDDKLEDWDDHKVKFNHLFLEFDDKGPILTGNPSFSIERGESNSTEFSITKYSHGNNPQEAIKNAKNIEYEWQQDDSILYLNRYFQLIDKAKFRNQKLNATLKIPIGKVIYIGKNVEKICSYIENTQDYSCDEMTGHYWIMTQEGLKIYGEKELYSDFKNETDSLKSGSSAADTIRSNIKKEIEDMKNELDSM